MNEFSVLLNEINHCTICQSKLPCPPKPILQVHPNAKILIAGQAPGIRAHDAGIPFDDASGTRLRQWLGLSEAQFYDPQLVALVPMGFCFPGSGSSGDLPPRPECAATWREPLLQQLNQVELTIVLGAYAQRYHLQSDKKSVTALVESWRDHWPNTIPLPHPSPRNNRWLRNNPWFEQQLLPQLQLRIATLVGK